MENNNSKKIVKIELSQNHESTDPYKRRKKIIYFCFGFIGLFNNLGFVLIITSAQQFSSKLNDDKLIAFYPLALIIFDFFSRFINSKFCITISYFKRVLGLSIYFCFGYFLLFIILTIIDNKNDFNQKIAFILTLIPSIIMGTGQAFGEVTFLGYIRTFHENYVSGWSSGTGLAGIVGALLSIIFKLLNEKFNLKNLYLILSLVTALFFFAFYITFKVKKNIDYIYEIENDKSNGNNYSNKIELEIRESKYDKYDNTPNSASNNKRMTLKNFFIVFKYGKRYILNMFIVYFLEYTVCSGFCERSNYFKYIDSKNMFFEKAQYEIFLLFYQLGVFISRSSLFIFKYLNFVELLNIFQLINFIFWLIEATMGIISNQWFCFFTLFLLGLCGGGVYVGCFYFILNDNRIPPEYKELCLNICTIFIDLGVLLSSIICIIFDNYIQN